MRPLKLVMNAFGPYAGRQEIDFRELGGNSLFLINGPTGGGKTTILDAICYALYGETSGKERDDKRLRSDLAVPDDIAEVELTFAVGESLLRVTRSPTQERAKIHGEGTTVQQAKARLIELGPEEEEVKVLGAQITAVNRAVSDILGFQSDQFRQVIMLPQGQFRKLLLASSKERGQILARLFDTSIYRKVEESLKDRARSLRKEMNDLNVEIQARLDHFGFRKVKQLEKKSGKIAGKIKESTRKLEKLRKKEKKADRLLREGLEAERKFLVAGRNREALAALEGQKKEMGRKKARFEAASRAARLADVHSRHLDELEQAGRAGTARTAAEQARDQAAADLESAADALAETEKQGPRMEELKAGLVRLNDLRGKVRSLAEASRSSEEAAGRAAKAERESLAKQEAREQTGKEQQAVDHKVREITARLVDERLLSLQSSNLEKEIRNRGEAVSAQAGHRKTVEDLELADKQVEETGSAINGIRKRLKGLRARHAAGHAAILARGLKPGEACPVCGSPDHPEPAAGAEDIPGEEEIESMERRLEESEERGRLAATRRQELLQESGRLEERIRASQSALENLPERSRDEAERELKEVERQGLEQMALRGELENAKQESQELKDRLERLRQECEALEYQHAKEKQALETARAVFSERAESIPEEYREPEGLEQEISAKDAERQRLEQIRESLILQHADSKDRSTRAESDFRNAGMQAEKRRKAAEKATRQWLDRLAKEAFENEKEFLAARLEDGDRTALESKISEFDRRLELSRDMAKASARELSGLQRPDLACLKQNQERIASAREGRREKLGELRNEQEHVEQALADLRRTADKLSGLGEDYAVVGGLSDLANGGYNRMSFERFVLAALLDDVLRQSSERLGSMSKGRYRLNRANYPAEQQSSGGLDLEVEDAYTGMSRPVSTLSGGESFQAALSLALGLADVVQAYAGGVMLDTIFIDEGFGSLDEEALDLAINTLIDLQSSGRLVGVISHVADMKERIDAQLVVSAGERGASAEFRLP